MKVYCNNVSITQKGQKYIVKIKFMDYKKTAEFDRKGFTMKKVMEWGDEIMKAVMVAKKL
jgi:hypothetical protein